MDIPDYLKIPEEIIEKLKNPEEFRKEIEQGKSLQSILGYTDDSMEKFYQAARTVFAEGRYQDSQDAFLFLTTLNPHVYAYWVGLGMSYQKLEEYEQAILAYECASKVHDEFPIPYFYQAACHHLMHQKDEAKRYMALAKQKCIGKPDYQDFLHKITLAEEKIK